MPCGRWEALASQEQSLREKVHLPGWLTEQEGTWRAFQKLQPNCEPKRLLQLLTGVRLAHEFHVLQNTFDDQIGFGRKELRTVIARMRKCAKNVERLRIAALIQTLSSVYPATETGAVHRRPPKLRKVLSNLDSLHVWQSNLPYHLNQLADAAELVAKALSFRGRPLYDENLASLVCYVYESTERWHDDELSVLVAVTGRDDRYSAEAHRRWRMTHRKLCRS